MSTANTPTRQLPGNRHTPLNSTGAKTLDGKGVACRPGLTGRNVLLPGDDAEAYEHHIQRFAADFKPLGDRETELVQSLADTQWRLNRIPALEAGIYALAHLEMADLFPEEAPAVRHALIGARAYLTHTRQINNLHLQEARLRRHYEKDLAELRSLQAGREPKAEPEMASNFQPAPAVSPTPATASAAAAEMASNFQIDPAMPAGYPQVRPIS